MVVDKPIIEGVTKKSVAKLGPIIRSTELDNADASKSGKEKIAMLT
jgi:hypothetical protein